MNSYSQEQFLIMMQNILSTSAMQISTEAATLARNGIFLFSRKFWPHDDTAHKSLVATADKLVQIASRDHYRSNDGAMTGKNMQSHLQ